jgi:integrase
VFEPVRDDVILWLLGLAGVRDKAIVLLFLDTGLRLSEITGLHLRDLRPDGSVKVMGKGARERIGPVGAAARRAVSTSLAERRATTPDDAVFMGQQGPLGDRGIAQILTRLKVQAGISGRLSPHSLRHTFARAYLVNGGDIFTLQRILGHSTLDMRTSRHVTGRPRLPIGWSAGSGRQRGLSRRGSCRRGNPRLGGVKSGDVYPLVSTGELELFAKGRACHMRATGLRTQAR